MMSGYHRVRRVELSIAILMVCLVGCQQTETVRSSPTDSQSSWFSKLAFWKSKDKSSGMSEEGPDVRMTMARSFEKQGQIDQAIKTYLEIVKKDESRADAHHRLAVLHDIKGDCKSSEGFYRAALEKDPENPELHCDLGYSYYLQRRWPEAEASLRQALSLEPDLTRAHINYGLLLARAGRVNEALVEFNQAGCPEVDARTNLAFAFMLQQRWADAQQQYEHALAINPQSKAAQDGLDTLRSLRPRVERGGAIFAHNDDVSSETTRAAYIVPQTENASGTFQ